MFQLEANYKKMIKFIKKNVWISKHFNYFLSIPPFQWEFILDIHGSRLIDYANLT